VAGEVLTAADLNITNSGIPVFASTVERDAAFGGTGEKTLAEGQYAYLESTNQTLVYDGSNWISVGVAPALVLIKTQTVGTTVASVQVTDAFSATYDNYLVTIDGTVGSTAAYSGLILGATTTGYYNGSNYFAYDTGTPNARASNNGAKFVDIGRINTLGSNTKIEFTSPFLTVRTGILYSNSSYETGTGGAFHGGGFLDNATSYTAFTFSPNSGTITGGTIRVYGYTNS
jgi:hypothetical protein